MKTEKIYTIIKTRKGVNTEITGTLPELMDYFRYSFECGKSWEHERGCKKINMNPKTIKSFMTNLGNAKSNSAMNGNSNEYFTLKEEKI
jgi:hypothetical protein